MSFVSISAWLNFLLPFLIASLYLYPGVDVQCLVDLCYCWEALRTTAHFQMKEKSSHKLLDRLLTSVLVELLE